MNRYALIKTQMPREFILLQGTGCRWRRCSFCDYHLDTSEQPYQINAPVLRQISGCYGIIDVINSGSAMELDSNTIEHLQRIIYEKHIHTLWFEAHYLYRHRLSDFARQFLPATVKYRCGIETFNPILRKAWNKGIPTNVSPENVARYFHGICLLCCVEGQTRQDILNDISIARNYFEYFSLNVFCNNTTSVRRDSSLLQWFIHEVYPDLRNIPNIEILFENTDLGVGEL